MLVLCSNGLSSENLLDAMGKRIKKKKYSTAAVVVTVDHEYKEKNYHVNRITRELASLNLRSCTNSRRTHLDGKFSV